MTENTQVITQSHTDIILAFTFYVLCDGIGISRNT